jgi:GTP-binding protein
VLEAGRGLVVVANKWDLVEEKDARFKDLTGELGPFANAPAVRTSAARGTGVHRLPPLLIGLHERWRLRVPTAAVNELLGAAQAARPLPRGKGKLHYATQVSSGPPAFVLFGASSEPGAGYARYLENRLRESYGWNGVPIRLRFRRGRARRRNHGGRR